MTKRSFLNSLFLAPLAGLLGCKGGGCQVYKEQAKCRYFIDFGNGKKMQVDGASWHKYVSQISNWSRRYRIEGLSDGTSIIEQTCYPTLTVGQLMALSAV